MPIKREKWSEIRKEGGVVRCHGGERNVEDRRKGRLDGGSLGEGERKYFNKIFYLLFIHCWK